MVDRLVRLQRLCMDVHYPKPAECAAAVGVLAGLPQLKLGYVQRLALGPVDNRAARSAAHVPGCILL